MIGGTGHDDFQLTAGADILTFVLDHGHDTVRGFAQDKDILDVSAVTGSFDSFAIDDVDADGDGNTDDARIDLTPFGGGVIDLIDVAAATLDADDFRFTV